MAHRALAVYAGSEAARTLRREGWSADLFDLLLGASGGPKWFVLSQLDRVLFGDFLQRRSRPLAVLGSSIGAWRHACLALSDPAAAIARLEEGYLHQHYRSARPSAEEVSEFSLALLQRVLGPRGTAEITHNDYIRTHIVTARGRGAAAASATPLLATAMGAAALGNGLSRNLLQLCFQRVVFHSGQRPEPGLLLDDFGAHFCPLDENNVVAALHATGAIPFVLTGERDIAGGPAGQYWDGGIIDYHFDLNRYRGEGLVLYPHFRRELIPGWFDKFLPWRRTELERQEKMVLLCPSEPFIADLPQGKIPDRGDFKRLGSEERVRSWERCVERGTVLAGEFAELVAGADPLAGVTVFD